jgi:DNA invertase Pin-like site-specific DNA recombinase
MEADFIASRVADGMAVAKSKGVVFGRPKMSPQKQQEIIRLRKEGFSMNNIAKQLNVGNSQVHRICKEMLEAA